MRVLLLVLVVLALVSCTIIGGPPHNLAGTSWSLVRVSGQPALPGAEIAFSDNRRFEGWTGCNSFWGRYGADSQSFSVTELGKQEAGCRTDALFRQEQALVDVLMSARQYKGDGSRPTVMGADGVLVFGR